MKRVLAIAALLMVGCGTKQQQSESAESNQQTQSTNVVAAPKKKVSLKVQEKELPELKVVMPKRAATDAKAITADKDIEFITIKQTKTDSEE